MEILLVLGLCVVIIVILYKDLDKEWKASDNFNKSQSNVDTYSSEVQSNADDADKDNKNGTVIELDTDE